jgi:hypothetical protein
MPGPNDYPTIQFNATPIIDKIRPREDRSRSEHQTARRDLTRYYKMLGEERPAFTHGQASLLCDLLNGVIFEPIDHASQILQIEVQDAPDRLFKKWGVDPDRLEKRVADLSFAEALATIDAVERFWASAGEKPVTEVGLCGDEAMRN